MIMIGSVWFCLVLSVLSGAGWRQHLCDLSGSVLFCSGSVQVLSCSVLFCLGVHPSVVAAQG